MDIREYSNALSSWSEIDNGDVIDVLRRIVLMANGMLCAVTPRGDFWQWDNREWRQIGIGNQTEGMTMPVAEELTEAKLEK